MAFKTTRWIDVENLSSADEASRADAMGELARVYGPPLFAFARREFVGLSREDCEDLVAAFFLRCLEHEVLQAAHPSRGRFRSFLCKAFKNFGLNALRGERTQKRAPSGGWESIHALIDEHGPRLEPRSDESPEDTYSRVLRRSLFVETLSQFERDCRAADQTLKYELFERRELAPLRDGTPVPSYEDLRTQFDLPSVDAVGRIVRAAKEQFMEKLTSAVSLDAESGGETEYEASLVFATGLHG